MACDGLWDVLDGAACAATLDASGSLEAATDALLADCVARKSRDNVTCIALELEDPMGLGAMRALRLSSDSPMSDKSE